MAKNAARDGKRRTQVKDMPQPEKELTKDEQRQVKGGLGGMRIGASGPGSTDAGGGSEPQETPHLIRIIE